MSSTKRTSPVSESETHFTTAQHPDYPGKGTVEDPFIVDWLENDPEDPRQWTKYRRWLLTLQLSFSTWNLSFASSSYSGGLGFMTSQLHTTRTLADLGISLYVLGFGVGLVINKAYHIDRIVFMCSYTTYLFFHLGGALATNIQTIVVCRLLGGIAGSAPLSNAGAQVTDMWHPRERAMAVTFYSLGTFLGPISGPIIGGFVSQSTGNGWRIVFWIMFGLSALVAITSFFFLAETYPPVLLRRRAWNLQKTSGGRLYYVSIHDRLKQTSLRDLLMSNLKRPFVFLFTEPIVTLIALYISVAYATLYAQFVAFPIVFEQHRRFSPGDTGLAFLGIALGQWIALATTPLQNSLYRKAMEKGGGTAVPEARLYVAVVGGIALPLSMFWFAWTSAPAIPAIVPILSGIPFGLGTILIMTTFVAFLMDAYPLYCASALAANVLVRSVFAAAFPLFSPAMFQGLGDAWGSSVFAFVSLVCVPIPILFMKYGRWLRSKSYYALQTPAHPSPPPSPTIHSQERNRNREWAEK
ncbi:MFS general substrate transporter [Hysterangium stoloniferum]|nr:MFS general substrate transporter [Hysterangium stoloniferum]